MEIEVQKYLPGDALEAVADDIWKLLCLVDREFVPPLSRRRNVAMSQLNTQVLSPETLWGGPVSYFDSLMRQEVALARVDGTVAGLISWADDFIDLDLPAEFNPSFRVTTIATHADFTKNGIATELVGTALEQAKASDRDWVVARHWSQGLAEHMWQHHGFNEILRLPNHRGPGIDTIYFARHNNPIPSV